MSESVQLGSEALFALSLYLAATLAIGFVARRAGAERGIDRAQDYFLGGKATGALLLFFTMQATQYSGNAFFGFTGMGYRNGLIWILSIPLITLIITTQLAFAPRLYVLSKRHHYLTPADYYAHRYDSGALRLLVAVLTILSMFPYLMIQAEATGHAVVALSSGNLPFWSGVVGIAVVMGIYISVGGWRGVIWTDAVQGVLLTAAMLASTYVIVHLAGGVGGVVSTLHAIQPHLLAPPQQFQRLTADWLSLLIVSAIGFAMYPQAIQRIYAARSENALKRSYVAMLCVPFLLGACTLLIGLSGAALEPGLEGSQSDRVFGLLLARMVDEHYWLVVFVLCGLLAAIMSTASSVVLTLASIFTRDIYQSALRPAARETELTLAGRVFVLTILFCVVLASAGTTTTLWRLTEIKIEFLMQLFPALILGLFWPRTSRLAVFCGMVGGTGVAAAMMLTGHARWWLFQAGLYGFVVNLMICVAVTLMRPHPASEQQRVERDFFEPFRALPPRVQSSGLGSSNTRSTTV